MVGIKIIIGSWAAYEAGLRFAFIHSMHDAVSVGAALHCSITCLSIAGLYKMLQTIIVSGTEEQ